MSKSRLDCYAAGSDGNWSCVKEGQSFIIRFFSGQNAYAFTSVVARQTSVPFPHAPVLPARGAWPGNS
ncbi:MAG: flagellar brake domain-containing protein [Betaproteobacteria bacterium]|nr:flagellar brake domain-containing protein [Candidatus Dechloromonas phosphorivorans]